MIIKRVFPCSVSSRECSANGGLEGVFFRLADGPADLEAYGGVWGFRSANITCDPLFP